jgi:hypothetical protein
MKDLNIKNSSENSERIIVGSDLFHDGLYHSLENQLRMDKEVKENLAWKEKKWEEVCQKLSEHFERQLKKIKEDCTTMGIKYEESWEVDKVENSRSKEETKSLLDEEEECCKISRKLHNCLEKEEDQAVLSTAMIYAKHKLDCIKKLRSLCSCCQKLSEKLERKVERFEKIKKYEWQ